MRRPNKDAPPPPLRLADFADSAAPAAASEVTPVAAPTLVATSEAPGATAPPPTAETVAQNPETAENKPASPTPSSNDAPVAAPIADKTKPKETDGEAMISCRADRESRELKVICSDGKSWTMHAAGLILPPVLRCSTQHPECCQLGFSKVRDVQLADLLRVGEGQAPLCYMRVRDFLTNPPSQALAARDRLDDELPPGLRTGAASVQLRCPKGQYPALGGCHDARQLMRALKPPAVNDPNRPLVPEAEEVVVRMRRDFDLSGRCPQAALDIDVLKRIYNAAQLRAELATDAPLDVTPLIARAQSPGSAQPEPQLPASCGYNATYKTWFQTSFHCASGNMCFAQSHEAMAHTCVRFDRATTASGTSPYFWPLANCQNVPSCIAVSNGQCTGVARFTALGSGIFLMIQEDPTGQPYYYGVLFSRVRPRTASEAAEAKRARGLLYDMARNLPSEAERARLRSLIDAQPE